MPDIGAALSEHVLAVLRGFPDTPRCWVAYSGGLDSSVLLDLVAGLREPLALRLSAVHIDHGLHPASGVWAQRCASRCAELGVPLVVRRIDVPKTAGQGPEAAARAARYAALAGLLGPGDPMLVAHHRDDQAETLLLALLRGAGVRGLAAMPDVAPLGEGYLVRPLLGFPRAALRSYAEARGLDWIDDPSNLDLDLDRNWLRAQVHAAPGRALACHRPDPGPQCRALCRGRGPGGAAGRGRGGAGAGSLPGTLSVVGLAGLDPVLCRAVLRHWLAALGLPTPDSRHLARVIDEAMTARVDASPLVAWPGCEVRRYRDDLFALAPLPPSVQGRELPWASGVLDLPAGLGRLHLRDAAGTDVSPETLGWGPLRVRFGVQGLRCRPQGGARHRPLKHLYQEAGVPPWLRGYVPLVFAGNTLVAVGDLWLCAGDRPRDRLDLKLVWAGHPWLGFWPMRIWCEKSHDDLNWHDAGRAVTTALSGLKDLARMFAPVPRASLGPIFQP